MKKLLLLGALFLAAGSTLRAQTFTTASGYLPAQALFSVPESFTISGLSTNSAGDIFYLATGPFDIFSDTRLMKRTASSNFLDEIPLFSDGLGFGGNFVRVLGSTVYFATYASNDIQAIGVNGGMPTAIGQPVGAYDLAFSGGAGFLSRNPSGFPAPPNTVVSRFDLTTGDLDTIIDTEGDYSGPVAFTADGRLLYGATGVAGTNGDGIYAFSAAQVAGATGSPDPALTLAQGTLVVVNSGNTYLAYVDDQHLYSALSVGGSPATITRYNLSDASSEAVGQTGNPDFFLSGLTSSGSDLLAVVTADYFNGPSTVFRVTPAPEPSAALLCVAGIGCLLSRRARQKCASV